MITRRLKCGASNDSFPRKIRSSALRAAPGATQIMHMIFFGIAVAQCYYGISTFTVADRETAVAGFAACMFLSGLTWAAAMAYPAFQELEEAIAGRRK